MVRLHSASLEDLGGLAIDLFRGIIVSRKKNYDMDYVRNHKSARDCSKPLHKSSMDTIHVYSIYGHMHQTLSLRAGDAIHPVHAVELRVWLVRLVKGYRSRQISRFLTSVADELADPMGVRPPF